MSRISDDIKLIRKTYGLTQAQLGEVIGFSRIYICAIERGEREAGLSFLWKLSQILVTPYESFLALAELRAEDYMDKLIEEEE